MDRYTTGRYLLRILGVLCLACCGLFLVAFMVALSADSATERYAAEPLFVASLGGIVVGLLVMIGHLRLTARLSAVEKQTWSWRLGWLGPLGAGWYLLTVAGDRPAVAARTHRDGST